MKIILPASFPETIATALESLGFDLLATSATDLMVLFNLSGKERRILFAPADWLQEYSDHQNAYGIIALGPAALTAEGFRSHVLPQLRAASQEAQFEAHITFFNGTGGMEVTRLLYENQQVRERISIPRGTNEQFLHFALNGLRELWSKGIMIGGFTRTMNGYQVERHPATFHFLGVVIDGTLEYSADGNTCQELGAKCTFIIPGGTHCSYRAKGAVEFLWLHIHTTAFGRGIGEKFNFSNLIYPADLVDYCEHFRVETRESRPNRDLLLTHLASVIELLVHRNVAALGMAVNLDEPRERLKEALRKLEDNLAASFSASDLARLAGISLSRLYRDTRRYFNDSPGNLIEELRVRHARELLLHSTYKLEKIAEMTGYSDAFTFSRAFKRLTGLPPSVFRRQKNQAHPRM